MKKKRKREREQLIYIPDPPERRRWVNRVTKRIGNGEEVRRGRNPITIEFAILTDEVRHQVRSLKK